MADLETPRLLLHPLTPDEAARLVAGERAAGEVWAADYPAEMDVRGAVSYLRRCAGSGDPAPFGGYEIRRRADGAAIGGLGFNRLPEPDGSVVIGYGLVPSAQGHGYASEALRGLLALARSLGVTVVKGDADHGNTASQQVMRAVGMRLVREDETVKYFETDWA
ncbi:GNAT family N-acetyltransferase [Streptacidiphilus carbonis]|uniref:GNAT family N-acetyltransferase n=1 Tax=Streptacidiphilus carbonis TaxID=105422 RepID=UPI0005A668EA|nr:GNAT family N-acetyltransferase [Streptacidiphilus carbonis]